MMNDAIIVPKISSKSIIIVLISLISVINVLFHIIFNPNCAYGFT
jgi:hypothetical protein